MALALALAATACGPGEPLGGPRPDVVLVTLDTTRADRLGCYGYERDTSPRLDALAAAGVVHEQAYSTSSWTLPAHASLFTGKFPASHGAQYDAEGPLRLTSGISGDAAWDQYRARGLSPEEVTLAGTLRAAGYATGAVIAGPWMKRVFGLDAGFEHYDDDQVHSISGRLAAEVTDAALAWVDGVDPARPLFLFLNYYDPHFPFEAPAPHTFRYLPPERRTEDALARRSNFPDLYDGELRYTDEQLGRLLDGLRERGRYEDALVVVTADHGELLGEYGLWGHGQALTQEELHVPLVVRYPRDAGGGTRSAEPIQLLDLPALVLAELELELPPAAQGGRPHPVIAEVYPLERFVRTGDWRILIDWPHKYAWNSNMPEALFDLTQPDSEAHNRALVEPELTAELRARLESYLAGLPPPPPAGPEATVDDDVTEALHHLGYMDGADGE